MPTSHIARRAFMQGAAVVGAVLTTSANALAKVLPSSESGFEFEIQRSDAEWRARLSDMEYKILRAGGTEEPKTSDLWQIYEPGAFHCKGCDLKVYDHAYQLDWTKGWVFFQHAEPNAVMMGIDRISPAAYGGQNMGESATLIETHCRRCGSHLGHMLMLNLIVVHCINGVALTFKPTPA